MHGLGNDYIYIDCFQGPVPSDLDKLAVTMSDRHFGVGGDGIVLIMRSKVADCRMRMFNSDGSEGRMCGNAIRCVGKYVYDHGYVADTDMEVETASGIKKLRLDVEGDNVVCVTVDMGEVIYGFINEEVEADGIRYRAVSVDVGNPHLVIPVKKLSWDTDESEGVFCNSEFMRLGPLFEKHERFPDKVNVEFVEQMGKKHLKMRVWERGSGETMACGTGACATVAAFCKLGRVPYNEKIKVTLRGGDLEIICTSEHRLFMKGPANYVFKGEYEWLLE